MGRATNNWSEGIVPGVHFREFERFLELIQHAGETGRPLPMSAGAIMIFEDAGAMVDLVTGAVEWPEPEPAAEKGTL